MLLNFPDHPWAGDLYQGYMFDGQKWKGAPNTGAASDSIPQMDGVASAGANALYSRGDHAHPTDITRAPIHAPVFTGGITTDTLYTSGWIRTGGATTAVNGRIVSQYTDQPGVCVYSVNRSWAMGMFLDVNNLLAFGSMDSNAWPTSNIARFDYDGNLYLNSSIDVGRDPVNWNDVATKQYVDGRNYGGNYLPLAGGSMSGPLRTAPQTTGIATGGGVGTIEIRGAGAGSDAFMSFHQRARSFANNFGLSTDGNLWFGGWSHGWQSWRFWTTRDFNGAPLTNSRMVHAGDPYMMAGQGLSEPYGGAVMTGSTGIYSQQAPQWIRYRYLQIANSGWWTVGYV